MKQKTYIILITMAVVFASCNKFLDVKPAGSLIPQEGDVTAFDRLLNNVNTIDFIYMNNNRSYHVPFLGDNLEMSDNQALRYWYNGRVNIQNYYAYTFQAPHADPNLTDETWAWGTYRSAELFNLVIDGVNDVRTPETEQYANEVIAQATVARAWSYFYAALGFGPIYRPGGDNSTKVLPYRTQSNVMAPMEDLSTVQEIFDRVLADINASLPNIPEFASYNTRFGKVQTYAFLAHYHMYTRQFDKVAQYANEALTLAAQQNGNNMDNLFFDMNLFSWNDPAAVASDPDARGASANTIKTPQSVDLLSVTFHRENCLYRAVASTGQSGTGSSGSYPSAEFVALFDPATDLRREFFFFEYPGFTTIVGGVTYDDGRRIENFQQAKMARTNGYSYPELLLMRAEGRARSGDETGALADLNYLRKFRHRTGTPDLAISGEDNIIMEIMNERRRELPIASPKRVFDLKRFLLDPGKPWAKTTIVRTVEGNVCSANVDSKQFIIPIRNVVLNLNPQWGIPIDPTYWDGNPH